MAHLLKLLLSLLPFIKELVFSKDLGATKGHWRRVTRISMIVGFVLVFMLTITLHTVIQQATQIRELRDEMRLVKFSCIKPIDEHYYSIFD